MVTVGTQVQVADTGILSVTSQRAAFLGGRKTIDMPYTKLIGMELFSDGVRFSLENRQTAPLLRVTCSPDVLGALLNAAIQAANVDESAAGRPNLGTRTHRLRRWPLAGHVKP